MVYRAPAGFEYARVSPGGVTILPNGRFLTPPGRRFYGRENVFFNAATPDGKGTLMIHSNGLTFYRDLNQPVRETVEVRGIAPCGAWLPDGRLLISTGDEGAIGIFDLVTKTVTEKIQMPPVGPDRGYINDMAVTPDGKTAYLVDVVNQRLITVDLVAKRVRAQTRAGRQPYAVRLAPHGKSLFVANIGLFNYSVIPQSQDPARDKAGIETPPFGFPSREAERGVEREGRFIPGLGDAQHGDAHSLFKYSIDGTGLPVFARGVKTGIPILGVAERGRAVGGSAPNSLQWVGGELIVANGNNDTIQAYDANTMRLKRTLKLVPEPTLARYRGVIPGGLSVDRAGKQLFVSECGVNSVAVVDLAHWRVSYRIPTGWWPTVTQQVGDRLLIACQKGLGRGPKGAMHRRPEGDERFGLPDMPGMVQEVQLPRDASTQARWSQMVRANNGLVPVAPTAAQRAKNPIPLVPGRPSDQIKYVVFITKENHTFDGIFGTLKGAKAVPEYAEWGDNGWVRERNRTERVPIMKNHLKLARQFAISDNFYMEPQASGDGHRWLVGIYPSYWSNRVFYTGWSFRAIDSAKGRLPSFGSNGSQLPEDYNENGSMWEHFHRAGLTFRNYGEGFEFPGQLEPNDPPRSGSILQVNHPINQVLWNNTDWEYPVYNTDIPDIARAEWFIEDLEGNFIKKGKKIPQFINITLCNDHGAGIKPDAGYPFQASYMADNDVALGRVIEYLSKRPEWKEMAVFVTQDDPGGDDDHVDRHRSFVLALGPWAKKGHVSKEHTSITSIIKTIYLIFGLTPNNMFDAVSTDLRDMFTMRPDFSPYQHEMADPRVFVAEKAYDPTDPKVRQRRFMRPPIALDDPEWIERMGTDGDDDDD